MRKTDLVDLWEFFYIVPFGMFVLMYFSLLFDNQVTFSSACVAVSLFIGFAWIAHLLRHIIDVLEGLK